MAKFYSISLINEYAFILYIEKKNDLLEVLESFELEVSELASFVKNKKNFYISVEQTFEYSENIKVPVAIANSSNVKNYLFYKIKEANPNKDILFNFKKLPKQNDEENITYNVEVVDEKEYMQALSFVDDLSKIKSTTINKFALLSLANKCVKDEYYICVYTTGKTVLVLAVEQKELIFSRVSHVDASDPQTFQMNMAENITQTISYISNQFREIDFKTLILSGAIALDDVIPQHIIMLNKLNISILYPNTFVRNIDAEDSQTYILPLGVSLVSKQNQLLPKALLAIRQFNFASTILLILSACFFFIMCYFTWTIYLNYSDLKDENKVLQNRYSYLITHTKMLSQKQLQRYKDHISMVEKYLQNAPQDVMLLLKPLVEINKPVSFEYKNEKGNISFQAVFEKHFTELKSLYKFEKKFDKRFAQINKMTKLEKKVATDYEKLIYKVTINNTKETSRVKRERKL